MRLTFVFLLLISLSSAFAKDVMLTKVGSKGLAENSNLYIEINEKGDIKRFRQETFYFFYWLKQVDYFSVAQVKKGINLREERGMHVVKLKSTNITAAGGGDIKMSYLKSALSKKYGEKDIDLTRDGDDWKLLDPAGKEFNQVTLVLKKMFGTPIGIKKILFTKK
ncbi:MAG: hypothetical protein HOE90_19595 [Bacteriovoracaceae bacterium]|jgi:hypothetical protein|nr:hypothetical protein [Bacteriovoracaceae bacterium]